MTRGDRLVIALAGVSSPGYRSLANAYLRESVKSDMRLPEVWVATPEFPTTADPWWIAYQLLELDPAPDVFGFSVVCWNARTVYETVRLIKASRPDAYIVVGGPEVGPIAEEVIAEQPGIDAIVRGEGERALPDLLHCLTRGGDPGAVPGIVARVGDAVVVGPARPALEDLDALSSPFSAGGHATDGSAYLETYRGCPHRCGYCYEGKGEPRIRSFSWERIASDIEAMASTPGITSFSFIDPVFNLTSKRLERLSDLLAPWAALGVRLHTIEVDIERIDDAHASLLARAGVVSVETGPQTVGAAALATCGRTFDAEAFRKGVEACRRQGISVECDLIVGLPGDTERDVLDGIDFAIELDPGRVQLSTLHVLPGTDIWARATELGVVFDRHPPHEVIRTRELSFGQLRRLEVQGNAASAIYRARLT